MNKYIKYTLLLFAGLIYALGFPSFVGESLLITPIIAYCILFNSLFKNDSLKEKIIAVILFSLTFNLTAFYWIAQTLSEFGDLPYWLGLLLSLSFTFFITPYLWVAIIIIWFTQRKFNLAPNHFLKNGLTTFAFAVLMTLVEYFTPAQFPTNIGAPWISLHQWLGFASTGGLPIYSFFSYLIIFELLSYLNTKSASKFNILTILLFIFVNPFLSHQYKKEEGSKLDLRLVQANISNFLKTDSENGSYPSVSEVLKRYYDLSLLPYPTGEKPDLIIWPETAYPFSITTDKDNLSASDIPFIFKSIISYWNTELFIGGYDNIKDDPNKIYYKTEYNSAFLFSANQQIKDVYHKHILIPFGETLPLGPFTEYVAPYLDKIAFFSEGNKFTEFNLATGHRITAAICYEVLKPEFIRNYLNKLDKKPHAIINLTNDSWYGDTSEPKQHLFLTKWRAIENQIPIIRSTNTGITSIIYPDGSESTQLLTGKTGNLDLRLNLQELGPTLFQKYGILNLLPLWLLYFIFHQLLLKLKSEKD